MSDDTGQSGRWVEVRIPGGEVSFEILADILQTLGALGVVPEGDALRVFFRASRWREIGLDGLVSVLDPFRSEGLVPEGEITVSTARYEDWVGRWRRALGPIRVGERLVVVPPGVAFAANENDLVLGIEPRMAFGTGEHATTRMALELLEMTVTAGMRVLDLGCGNGILSIAALLLGAGDVVAVDREPESIEESRSNLASHGFSSSSRVIRGDALALRLGEERFDLVLANILFRPVLAGLQKWTALIRPAGRIIVTGIRAEGESEEIAALASSLGLRVESVRTLDGWWAARFNRADA